MLLFRPAKSFDRSSSSSKSLLSRFEEYSEPSDAKEEYRSDLALIVPNGGTGNDDNKERCFVGRGKAESKLKVVSGLRDSINKQQKEMQGTRDMINFSTV
jgi:hypothetical protein